MKKIFILLAILTMCSFCSHSEALDLKHLSRTTYFDRDSGYVDREYMMVDMYDIDLQNDQGWLDWYQKRMEFNNNIRRQVHSAKFTAVCRKKKKKNRYGKVDSGCLTCNFECYDKNNRLIFKNKNIFEEYRGSIIAIRLQGIFSRNFSVL